MTLYNIERKLVNNVWVVIDIWGMSNINKLCWHIREDIISERLNKDMLQKVITQSTQWNINKVINQSIILIPLHYVC